MNAKSIGKYSDGAMLLEHPEESDADCLQSDEKLKLLMIAPAGEGLGGILTGANALFQELRKLSFIELRVIDSAQRYRDCCDLRLSSRVFGGAQQLGKISFEFFKSLLTFRPDTVSLASSASFGLVRDILLSVFARLFRVRTHVSFHFGRIPELAAARNWEWYLLSLVVRIANVVSVLDESSFAVLTNKFPNCQICLTPNAIDIDRIDGIRARANTSRVPQSVPLLVFVGMVLEAKGIVELVEACARITELDFELEVVGPVQSAMRGQLSAIAAERQHGEWLRFAGALSNDEAIERIAAADVFILPSHTEGFPISILEAMASGVAIVATNVGAIPEMLSGNNDMMAGIVVPPRDAALLKHAIEDLLRNPSKRRELGAAAREKCESAYRLSTRCKSMLLIYGWSKKIEAHHKVRISG